MACRSMRRASCTSHCERMPDLCRARSAFRRTLKFHRLHLTEPVKILMTQGRRIEFESSAVSRSHVKCPLMPVSRCRPQQSSLLAPLIQEKYPRTRSLDPRAVDSLMALSSEVEYCQMKTPRVPLRVQITHRAPPSVGSHPRPDANEGDISQCRGKARVRPRFSTFSTHLGAVVVTPLILATLVGTATRAT